jgi:hypothetical protein
MTTTRSYKINVPRITSQTIDDEVIIIDLQNGNYYSLTEAGAGVWSGIETGRFSDEIMAWIAAQYDGEPEAVKSSIEQFLDALLGEELIVVNESREIDDFAAALPTTASNGRPRFVPPSLQKYTDMQDLLLLDPIHEVDETGWPMLKPAGD